MSKEKWFFPWQRMQKLEYALETESLELFKKCKPSQDEYNKICLNSELSCIPLKFMILRENVEFAEYLVKNYKYNENYQSPLYTAFRTENLEMAKMLVRNGYKLCEYDSEGYSPHHYIQDIKTLKYFMDNKMLDNTDGIIKNSIYNNNFEMIDYFISIGRNLNQLCTYNSYPLGLAIQYENIKMTHYLCERGADVNYSAIFPMIKRASKFLLILSKFGANINNWLIEATTALRLDIITTMFFMGANISGSDIEVNENEIYRVLARIEAKELLDKLALYRREKIREWLKDLLIKDLLNIALDYVDIVKTTTFDECEILYQLYLKDKDEVSNMKFYK